MLKLKRSCLAIAAAVLMTMLAGCGNNTEGISGTSSTTQSTDLSAPASNSSTAESSTSSLTESSSDTSSVAEPVEEPQPEKIPLTDEELDEIFIGSVTMQFFKPYEKANKEFDLTVSIDNVEMLDYILTKLIGIVENGEFDDYERISDPEWLMDTEYYYFKLETAEKLIQKYFLPTFMISSIDYTKSEFWDPENNWFKPWRIIDGFMGARGLEYYYLNESGYKAGDYYYVSLVPLADYPNAEMAFGDGLSLKYPEMSYISSDYFDIPRVRLKLKKFIRYSSLGDTMETYVCVGFAPVDERPDWLKFAAKLFKDNDLENASMIGQPPIEDEFYNMPAVRTAGVINTPFGKRMYVYEKNYREGMLEFHFEHTITTFGTRGQNDKVIFSVSTYANTGTDGVPNVMASNVHTSTFTCDDLFSGNKYVRELRDGERTTCDDNLENVSTELIHNEKWTMNDKEISETEFTSAEPVSYFLKNFKGDGTYEPYTFYTLYSCKVKDCITLADYYEMCRVITE